MKKKTNTHKRAAAAFKKIAQRKFDGLNYGKYFYKHLQEHCEEVARPIMSHGYLVGGPANMLKVFESGPKGEKWYSWFQYFILCYLTQDVPLLARRYINKIKQSGDFSIENDAIYGDAFPDIRYERAKIVFALSDNYPHSSPYYFLMHGLALFAARPGFFAPSFGAIFYHYLNQQDYDMVLSCCGLFFQECEKQDLYAGLDEGVLSETLEVVDWILARPETPARDAASVKAGA
ncbi:MAG: hypothetical protein NXI24_05175 [bacterium]|nr:hypothetical protein [bacterium]